jgi:hypothetical protein
MLDMMCSLHPVNEISTTATRSMGPASIMPEHTADSSTIFCSSKLLNKVGITLDL